MERSDHLIGSWLELLRVLENLAVHHGRARHFTKEELFSVLTALYEIAHEEVNDAT